MHDSSFYDLGWLLIYSPEYSKWFHDFKVCYRAVSAQPCHPPLFPPQKLLPHFSSETTLPRKFQVVSFFSSSPPLWTPSHTRITNWCDISLTKTSALSPCLVCRLSVDKHKQLPLETTRDVQEKKKESFIKKLRKSINCNLILLFHVFETVCNEVGSVSQRHWTKQKKNPLTCSLTFVTGGRSEVSLCAGDACAVTMIL